MNAFDGVLFIYLSTLLILKSLAKNWQQLSDDYTMMFGFTQTKTFSVFWFCINPVTHCFILFPFEVINNIWWYLCCVLVNQDRWMDGWRMDEWWMDGSLDNGSSSLMIKSFLCFYCLYVREKRGTSCQRRGVCQGSLGRQRDETVR